MGMLRKILRAVLFDDGGPSIFSGLLPGAQGADVANRRSEPSYAGRKTTETTAQSRKSRS